jgi:GNAT superfamily N-acetyltransferase
MILLDKQHYHKIDKQISQIPFNTIFAETVIKGEVEGSIYVDDIEKPSTIYIVHPYSMSLLFGETDNHEFNKRFVSHALNNEKKRKNHEYMQVFPHDWKDKLSELLGDSLLNENRRDIKEGSVTSRTRVNFRFNPEKYKIFKRKNIIEKYEIIRSDIEVFNSFKGAVTPVNFFRDDLDFLERGVGFTLRYDNRSVSTSFSSFITETQLELGMETIEDYRGMGFALYTCSALIDYCIEKDYKPVWACMLENKPSFNLAQKLGFEPDLYLPYFILSR